MKPTDRTRRLRLAMGMILMTLFCQACQLVQNEFWSY